MATTDNGDYLSIHRRDPDEVEDATTATIVYESNRSGNNKEVTGWVDTVDRDTIPVDGDFVLIIELPGEHRDVRTRPNAMRPKAWSVTDRATRELGDLVRLWLDHDDAVNNRFLAR